MYWEHTGPLKTWRCKERLWNQYAHRYGFRHSSLVDDCSHPFGQMKQSSKRLKGFPRTWLVAFHFRGAVIRGDPRVKWFYFTVPTWPLRGPAIRRLAGRPRSHAGGRCYSDWHSVVNSDNAEIADARECVMTRQFIQCSYVVIWEGYRNVFDAVDNGRLLLVFDSMLTSGCGYSYVILLQNH
jgi:hypothetical protein